MLTRQLFQPAMKRRAPTTTVTGESGPIHLVEEPVREARIPFQVEVRILPPGKQLVEARRIPHIHHAERVGVADPEVQFPVAGRQVHHAEPPGGVEEGFADVPIELSRALPGEMPEPAGEVVAAAHRVRQPGAALEKAAEHRRHDFVPREEEAEEVQDAKDIGFRLLVHAARSPDGLAQEHPQGSRQVERAPLPGQLPVQTALLVESQEAAEQVHVAVGVLHPLRQVGDGVVLAVPVGVEVVVPVVEQQTLGVGPAKIVVTPGHLVESGRVLDREPASSEFCPPLPPGLSGRAEVSFVHEDQVVVPEVAHRDPLYALLLRQFVDVQDLDRAEEVLRGVGRENTGVEAAHTAIRARAARTCARSA